jgi:hypothetical protein
MPRFATNEQITQVAGWASEIEDYRNQIDNVIVFLAGYIEALDDETGIETRYISGDGRDLELWRGNLLAASPAPHETVNVWCFAYLGQQGLPSGQDEAIGSFDKPVSLGIDYFFDYYFGTDENNSENVFNEKVRAFDLILEKIKTCLPNNAEIVAWNCRTTIQRFDKKSTHIAKFDVQLEFYGL